MNVKRALIGLSSTVFFVSAIVMVLLVIDDRKDLSSRASGPLASNLLPALPGVAQIPNVNIWDGIDLGFPVTINYNSSKWIPPKNKESVFYHLSLPITARIVSGDVDLASLNKILGADFTSPQNIIEDKKMLSGWVLQSYSFDFLGAKKLVDVWSGKEKISLVSVRPGNTDSLDIEEFVLGISPSSAAKVKGATTQDDTVRLVALTRPSVVMILNNFCSKAKFVDSQETPLSGKEYPFCMASVGSGFFVNKDGYIGTNGHVVKNLPSSSLFFSTVSGSLDDLLIDFMQYYVAVKTGVVPAREEVALQIKEAHAKQETIYQLAALVDELYSKKLLSTTSQTNKYYVQLGNTPLQLTKSGVATGTDILEAKYIDADYGESDEITGFSSSDVAIVKVEGKNYPGLPLGSVDDLSVGSNIDIIGFPGIVMGSNSFLLDTSANSEPTFTKGVVSAFKLAKGDKKRLIQTDASINHGNSGGPAISSDGKVIGIATYGLTPEEGSGNYNFLRDIQDLKNLMKKNNIAEDTGDTYKTWKSGLDNYWLSYFKYANSDFEKVSKLYPVHPSLGKYLAASKTKMNGTEDQTPKFTRSQRSLFMGLSGAIMALSLLAILSLLILEFLDSRKKRSITNSPLPPVISPPQII